MNKHNILTYVLCCWCFVVSSVELTSLKLPLDKLCFLLMQKIWQKTSHIRVSGSKSVSLELQPLHKSSDIFYLLAYFCIFIL